MVTDAHRKTYDKDLIRERTLDVLAHYLESPGKDQGSRVVWTCPSCGKAEKFAVKKAARKGGCLVAGCGLEGYEDVFSLVARFEDLDYRTDFLRILERAYEVLGIYLQEARPRTNRRSSNGKPPQSGPSPVSLKERPGQHTDHPQMPVETGGEGAPDQREVRELAARAYARIMELCPLESRDRCYLKKRGLSYETIERGRFGTMTAARAREVKAALQRDLGREALLSVPGFSEDEQSGRLKFTLAGDYLLIPFHDADGRITTIEGRAAGSVPEGMGKYVSLRRAGNHLYVFPDHKPADLLAVCEGVMGALVAAEAGLAVGAIQGCERYRASRSPDFPDGEPGGPLLELKGADFGGRLLPYVPDADDPPNPKVLRAAPKAARWLAEPYNAGPAICLLPDGTDLDEWLLSLRPAERRQRFEELLGSANPPEDRGNAPGRATGKALTTGNDAATKAAAGGNGRRGGSVSTDEAMPGTSEDTSKPARRPSRGARRLRDEVYRALLEEHPPKESHLGALSRWGVMRETARVGRLGSLDGDGAENAAARLVKRFGARRLLSVPGFERAGSASVELAFRGECLLLPCFDGEGLLSAVEALPIDGETGEVADEETVQLSGAGDHLYVFAAYEPAEIEGFCEGPLGALLAARDDVVVGAIGGFRRHGAGTTLPELDGVDLSDREVSYVPRLGCGGENARYHEAERAARALIEERGGRPRIVGVRDAGREDGPTSLAEWLLSVPETETQGKLRKLFPESPRRRSRTHVGRESEHAGRTEPERGGSESIRATSADRWRLHETPREKPPSTTLLTLPELVLVAFVWPAVYFVVGWLLKNIERLLDIAADFGLVPATGTLVAEPTHACAAMATLVTAFVLWRRRAMRVGEARMLSGRIEH